ncbi:MAG: glycosyltransferase [Bacteroidales bacterium]|jgi:cellulose synthase/poly-beta-1,6-N-acetylglucosamine synthase-like glycosyltransferase|nr:glycosyltransferase [Bacteroidales bacterium]
MILSTDTTHLILLALFIVMALIQTWYWIGYYRRSAFNKAAKTDPPAKLPPVSVVICARNEGENLARFLPAVLEQDYPSFEVVVVNDCSEDNTDDVLGSMIKSYPHLRVSMIQKDPGFTHTKKLAMLIGIKAAKNEMLVFTDADCRPVSANWLREVASAIRDTTDIVIGYGGYMPEEGFLNRYIRYETMFTGMQYFGMALAGMPYMGVGRNLAYRRSFFFERGGFGPHNHVMSGDDDLFVNRNANSVNCSIMLTHDSYTLSVAQKSISAWAKQKRRHLTASAYYKKRDKFRLFLEPFSRVAYYGLLTTLLIMLASWPVVAFFALTRLIMRAVILKKASVTFNEPRLWFISLFFDILAPFLTAFLYLTSTRKGKGRLSWK